MSCCPETLPSAAYPDPDWYERERRAIWAREWIYSGRLSDLAPGTMRRVAVAGENLIPCRDASGTVTAFHNSCRHRGTELCPEAEKPMGKLITCPYHAWAYTIDGWLVSVGHATPGTDFREQDHGLYKVQVQLWNGFAFLSLADDPPEFAPDLGLQVLENWPMADLVTGHRLKKVLNCNWKMALLHGSVDARSSPFPGPTHPAVSVTGAPRAVKPLRTATGAGTAPDGRSKARAAKLAQQPPDRAAMHRPAPQ